MMELRMIRPSTVTKGGFEQVQTDANGQATVTFLEPFSEAPAAVLLTPSIQLVAVGTLVLTESYVTVWVWDLSVGGWASNRGIGLYWMGVLDA